MSSLSHIDPLLVRARELLSKELPRKPTLWIKPPGDTPPHHAESRFYHPWHPEYHRLKAAGWRAYEGGRLAQTVLFGGRHKEENRLLLERARTLADTVFFLLPNEYGAKSAGKELAAQGILAGDAVGRKSRLFQVLPTAAPEQPLEFLQRNSAGFASAPGLFSWDRPGRGSEILAEVLAGQSLHGPLADLGAGWGYLETGLPGRLEVHLFEADRRGLEAARANLADRPAHFHWADVTEPPPRELTGRFSTVISNPPFHTGKKAEPVLGGAFVSAAHALLKPQGEFYVVGNVHLPYPKIMSAFFARVEELERRDGYLILRGLRK